MLKHSLKTRKARIMTRDSKEDEKDVLNDRDIETEPERLQYKVRRFSFLQTKLLMITKTMYAPYRLAWCLPYIWYSIIHKLFGIQKLCHCWGRANKQTAGCQNSQYPRRTLLVVYESIDSSFGLAWLNLTRCSSWWKDPAHLTTMF